MKTVMMAALLAAGLAAPALAANADQPNQNVDKRTDAGNSTGNNKVDPLNAGQLDRNQGVTAPALGTAPAPAQGQAQPPR